MGARTFDLADVLSVTTGKLVSRRHMDGIYDVLGFMVGESVFTHALPRVADEMRPVIFDQHPELMDVDASAVGKDNWQEWLAEQEARFGPTVDLTAAPNEHLSMHPLDEPILAGKKTIVVQVAQDPERS